LGLIAEPGIGPWQVAEDALAAGRVRTHIPDTEPV
jgi:hypothetical protein